MDALMALLGIVSAVLLLDALAVSLGADSRETLPDDHRR